jgi:hypothetical protein
MVMRIASYALLALLLVLPVRGDEEATLRPTLQGAVQGPNGQAVAGVRVDVSTAAPKVGRGIFCPSCYLDCGKWTKTDDSGNFAIPDVDPSLKFRLVLAAPGYRTLQTKFLDPAEGPASLALELIPEGIDAGRVVSGVVTQSGVPVAGALISPHGAKTAERRWGGSVEGVDPAVTDANGEFMMVLPEGYQAVDIVVTGDGLCGEQISSLQPGGDPVTIEARTGASVVGQLMHADKPAARMSIAVAQLERGVTEEIFIGAVGDVTDDDGRFKLQYLPPDQRYCIYSVAGEAKRSNSPYILATKTFTAPANGATRDLGSLQVATPCTIRGVVRRTDGQPLPKNLKLSLGRDPAWDLIGIPVNDDGSFEATGLPPETYEIRLGDPDLAIVADEIPYQILSEASFGVRLRDSIENLNIPVRGR